MNSSLFSGSWHLPSLLLALAISTGQASPADDAVKSLDSAIRKEITNTPKSAIQSPDDRTAARLSFLFQIEGSMRQDQPRQFEEILNQLPSYFASQEVADAANQVRTQIRIERDADVKIQEAKIRASIDAAAVAIRNAKSAADLDATLAQLSPTRLSDDDRSSEQIRATLDEARRTREFVICWQNYLFALQTGDADQTRQMLQEASNMDVSSILPRSEILSRLAASKSSSSGQPGARRLDRIVKTPLTLDGLPAAIEALDQVLPVNSSDESAWGLPPYILRKYLTALQQTYQSYRAGIPCDLDLSLAGGDSRPENAEILSLVQGPKIELLRIILPSFLNTAEKPMPAETIAAYLERMRIDASTRLDANMLASIMEITYKLGGVDIGRPFSFQHLISARRQDEAGQYAPAVVSYENALKEGGAYLPDKAIAARLAEIQAQHPAEYALGLQTFLNVPYRLTNPWQGEGSGNLIIRVPGASIATDGTVSPK